MAAGVVLALTACGGEDAQRPEASPTAGRTSQTPGPTASGGETPPATSSSALPGRCTRGDLDLSIGRVSPGAGDRYAPLVFTNTCSEPCSLRGYPGVTLLDSDGRRIGEPAEREGRRSGSEGPKALAVTLKPGTSAYAPLHTVADGVTDKPCWRRAAKVQAYPPGSTWALRTPANAFRVCGDVFEVGAVQPGRHP
ncbi:DUF4232 domain-containing protein [Streptomyces sp. NPDC003007]